VNLADEALTSGRHPSHLAATHWWLPSPSFSAGGACAWSRARWSIWHCGLRAAVLWFYFSDIYDDQSALSSHRSRHSLPGRRLALEKMRQRILRRMGTSRLRRLAADAHGGGDEDWRFTLSAARLLCSSFSWRWSPPSQPNISTSADLPRVWTRAVAVDPELPMRALPGAAAHRRWLPEYIALAKDATFHARSTAPSSPPYVLRENTNWFRVNLKVVNNTLSRCVRRPGSCRPGRLARDRRSKAVPALPATRCGLHPRRFIHRRHGAKPAAAQAQPGTLDRSDRAAQGRRARCNWRSKTMACGSRWI